MYEKIYSFCNMYHENNSVQVNGNQLYTPEAGYGFVIEKNRNKYEELKISELNSAFEPWSWLIEKEMTHVENLVNGCGILKNDALPLTFKCKVDEPGNYNVTVTIHGGEYGMKHVDIFLGRRRLYAKVEEIRANEVYEKTFTFNVCEIIPRGKEEAYQENSIDATILADAPVISKISIQKVDVPTIFIAGDSTVTDQGGAYPYNPGCCYSGWAQMLPIYLKPGIGVSNHAHSGLTTESFVNEGHYAIVEKHIKAGDYYFMQFGHNDQKLPHLDAFGGYAERIKKFVFEMRKLGAIPVIVTPLARNTWKGDGTYNDLLKEFAAACIAVGEELNVPVLDLHKDSMEFIIREGVESASRYFFPKDYTHGNDYGAYLMAGFVAKYCKNLPALENYIKENDGEFNPPKEIHMPKPPKEYELVSSNTVFAEEIERPEDLITRVEAIDFLIKAIRFVPTNVYNDHFPDVIGHEWYAGVVEVAFQNSIMDEVLIVDGEFHPKETVTEEEFMSFIIKSYSCRKKIEHDGNRQIPETVSTWAKSYIKDADVIGILPEDFRPHNKMKRIEAVELLKKLENLL